MQTERIDGSDYEIGTGAHSRAKRFQASRLDGEYVKNHPELVEAKVEELRKDAKINSLLEKENVDANQTAFLARDLVHVRAAIERTIYDETVAMNDLPMEGGHDPGAETYVTRRMDERGEARLTTDLNGDSPMAEVTMDEDAKKYVYARAGYSWNFQDMLRSAMSGTPLPSLKAIACAMMIARGLDRIARSGTVQSDGSNPIGLTGMWNSPLVTVHTLTNGEWDTETDTTKVIADLFEIEQTIIAAARDTQSKTPYTLFLPTPMEGRLRTLLIPNTTTTVKSWFLENSALIKNIQRRIKLDLAVSPEIAASDAPQGVCLPNDIQVLFMAMAVAYQEQAAQLVGWEYRVPAFAKVGGVDFRRPVEALYVQNFD